MRKKAASSLMYVKLCTSITFQGIILCPGFTNCYTSNKVTYVFLTVQHMASWQCFWFLATFLLLSGRYFPFKVLRSNFSTYIPLIYSNLFHNFTCSHIYVSYTTGLDMVNVFVSDNNTYYYISYIIKNRFKPPESWVNIFLFTVDINVSIWNILWGEKVNEKTLYLLPIHLFLCLDQWKQSNTEILTSTHRWQWKNRKECQHVILFQLQQGKTDKEPGPEI